MSENKDLEDRLSELERAKLQKRIAELESEVGAKTTGRIPGQESWRAVPINKRPRRQSLGYKLGEVIFTLLPLVALLFYFFKGGLTLWNISSENFAGSLQDHLLYFFAGIIL